MRRTKNREQRVPVGGRISTADAQKLRALLRQARELNRELQATAEAARQITGEMDPFGHTFDVIHSDGSLINLLSRLRLRIEDEKPH